MVVGLKQEMSVESGAASVSTGALTVEPSTQVHVYMYMMYETNVLSVLCVRACVCVYMYMCAAILLHSGEVYVFGHNKHGQLGQGNTKDW